jgi:hypothetical protein
MHSIAAEAVEIVPQCLLESCPGVGTAGLGTEAGTYEPLLRGTHPDIIRSNEGVVGPGPSANAAAAMTAPGDVIVRSKRVSLTFRKVKV